MILTIKDRMMKDRMTERDIVERIMTQHWDLATCPCWVCVAGRAAGCEPREWHQDHREGVERLAWVHVFNEIADRSHEMRQGLWEEEGKTPRDPVLMR